MKRCPDCGEIKNLSEFHRRTGRKSQTYCKPCAHKRSLVWRENNQQAYRYTHVKYKFNLSRDEFDELVRLSGGQCEICFMEYKSPLVDHDNKTGKVRGLLCHQCNTALGLMMDDPEILRRAANYIERSRDYPQKGTKY